MQYSAEIYIVYIDPKTLFLVLLTQLPTYPQNLRQEFWLIFTSAVGTSNFALSISPELTIII
jgi:hypothetical protein